MLMTPCSSCSARTRLGFRVHGLGFRDVHVPVFLMLRSFTPGVEGSPRRGGETTRAVYSFETRCMKSNFEKCALNRGLVPSTRRPCVGTSSLGFGVQGLGFRVWSYKKPNCRVSGSRAWG